MPTLKTLACCSVAASAVVIFCIQAMAQPREAWVSPREGNDASDCSSTRPCKTITRALSQERADTIRLKDPGEYDPVGETCRNPYAPATVMRSVKIIAEHPNKPCFNVGPSNGIVLISPQRGPNPTRIDVTLSGLHFIGRGYVGISFANGSRGNLTVENCKFESLNHGITFAAEGDLKVTKSTIQAGTGVRLDDGGDGNRKRKTATIIDCQFYGHNNSAVEVNDHGEASVESCQFKPLGNSLLDLAFKVNGDGKITARNCTLEQVAEVFSFGVGSSGHILLTNCEMKAVQSLFKPQTGKFETIEVKVPSAPN